MVVIGLLIAAFAFFWSVIEPYTTLPVNAAFQETVVRFLMWVVSLAVLAFLFWVVFLLIRGKLRTHGAMITPTSLPEVEAAIQRVCDGLSYPRERIEAFLVPNTFYAAGIARGMRGELLVITSPIVEAMYDYDAPGELEFIAASHVGTLRARMFRTAFLARAQVTAGAIPVLGFLIRPYLRATVYSADRLALMTTGDLQSAIDAVGVSMVGKNLSSFVSLPGWLRQHELSRWSLISFILRMTVAEPHPIDRLANVLCFGRAILPDQFEQLVGPMPEKRRAELEAILDLSRHAVRRVNVV